MKAGLTGFLLGVLGICAANASVDVSVLPGDPHVVLRDLDFYPDTESPRHTKAPWVQSSYLVKNDSKELIEVSAVTFEAVSVEGRKVAKSFPVADGKVAPGAEKTLGPFFLEALAESESLTYSVSATVQYKMTDTPKTTVIQFKTR